MTFQGVKINVDWTNQEWAAAHLPFVRLAAVALEKDDKELQAAFADMAKGGVVPDLLESWCRTKQHLKALVKGLEAALARSFLVLDRLGYTPDNPPPDSAVD
jgi:hypothetical protein